jgi:hypothetical protein
MAESGRTAGPVGLRDRKKAKTRAILGAVMAAALPGPGESASDLPARVDAALAYLAAGLP